jgi:hypothetical protein
LLGWAELGVLVSPFLHELQNHLNVVSLQARLLEKRLPPGFEKDLPVIRRAVEETMVLVRWLRDQRAPLDDAPGAYELGGLLKAACGRAAQRRSIDGAVDVYLEVGKPASCRPAGVIEIYRWLDWNLQRACEAAKRFQQAVSIQVQESSTEWLVSFQLCSTDSPPAGERYSIPASPALHVLENVAIDSIERRNDLRTHNLLEEDARRLEVFLPKAN